MPAYQVIGLRNCYKFVIEVKFAGGCFKAHQKVQNFTVRLIQGMNACLCCTVFFADLWLAHLWVYSGNCSMYHSKSHLSLSDALRSSLSALKGIRITA